KVTEEIEKSKRNAEENNISNVTFEVGAAEELLPQWAEKGVKADVILVDPPRKGLEPSFIESAVEMNPDRIVYVSCNPSTLARDLALFDEKRFKATEVTPVDLFPQTPHVQCVVALENVNQ